jgi:hypothetical protein
MNLLEYYHQSQFSKIFNKADIKGVISLGGFSFDIRVVNSLIYCNGLSLEDFLEEGMFSLDEKIECEQAIYQWLNQLSNSRVA